jgi:hypothetical protein
MSVPFPHFNLLSIEDMRKVPEPDWQIDGVLLERCAAVVYGSPNVGKSFLAVDMAMSIATGRPWQGRAVKQGHVIYILGEGGGSFIKRVDAWLQTHGFEELPSTVHFITDSMALHDESYIEGLSQQMKARGLNPSLIVADTLATCIVGEDENSTQVMGKVVEGARKFQRAFGASVLLVHHPGKNGDLRGGSALRGGIDWLAKLTGSGGGITLRCKKQKDAAWFKDIHLELAEVKLPPGPDGKPRNSLVVRTPQPLSEEEAQKLGALIRVTSLTKSAQKIGKTLAGSFSPLSVKDIMQGAKVAKATVHRQLEKLGEDDLVEQVGDAWQLTHRGREQFPAVQ